MTWNESQFQAHLKLEAQSPDGIHPDGCYYCGGSHPSDACQDSQAINEALEDDDGPDRSDIIAESPGYEGVPAVTDDFDPETSDPDDDYYDLDDPGFDPMFLM